MYCTECGNLLNDGISYCPKCGACVTNTQNSYGYAYLPNNQLMATATIDKQLSKIRVVTLLGIFCPIIVSIALLIGVIVIFVQGPCNGDMDNMHFLSDHELKEFIISYGLMYAFSLILNIVTFAVMLVNFKKFSRIQETYCRTRNVALLTESLNKLSYSSITVITIIDAILFFIFAIPQIIVCVLISVSFNEIKRNIRLMSM
ncbi:MAG: hypothetical protein ACI4IG_00070 [Eubacterium sp.]